MSASSIESRISGRSIFSHGVEEIENDKSNKINFVKEVE